MIGLPEAITILVALAILFAFGPRHIPKLARSIGEAFKEFKNAVREIEREKEEVKKVLKD